MTDSTSNTAVGLRHKIDSATELQAVVRTMKAMAASSIGQYENAVRSLDAYYHTVQLALSACFAQHTGLPTPRQPTRLGQAEHTSAVVFGSDQGLVGAFNETMVDFLGQTLSGLPGTHTIWAVGERIFSSLQDRALPVQTRSVLPHSIQAITPLVGKILEELELFLEKKHLTQVYLFYHRPQAGASYAPEFHRLLPLDETWRQTLTAIPWPTRLAPEVINSTAQAMPAFVREYLFMSVFRACAHSLASENASRLAAMQRAEKNIEELLGDMNHTFHRLRQSSIDEELFDVVAGFEALEKK